VEPSIDEVAWGSYGSVLREQSLAGFMRDKLVAMKDLRFFIPDERYSFETSKVVVSLSNRRSLPFYACQKMFEN
jgi:hypothetical protein